MVFPQSDPSITQSNHPNNLDHSIGKDDYYELKNSILEIKDQIINITYFKNHISIGFWLGVGIALLISFSSLGWAVREEIRNKISSISGMEKAILTKNLKEFDKHNLLRNNSKIITISKDKINDDNFYKVINLFIGDWVSSENFKSIGEIKDYNIDLLISELGKFDLIVIENTTGSTWDFVNEIDSKKQLVKLANSICDKTSIVYYGKSFPIEDITKDKQYLISFANAPSQLYGNILNMLKYRNEIGIKV